jgi:hypothetical protein
MAAFVSRDREAFTAHWARLLGDETVITKTIVFDGEVAGNVVSFEHAGRREVGYWIGRRSWGRGVATAALSAFLAPDPRLARRSSGMGNCATRRRSSSSGIVPWIRVPSESSKLCHQPSDSSLARGR